MAKFLIGNFKGPQGLKGEIPGRKDLKEILEQRDRRENKGKRVILVRRGTPEHRDHKALKEIPEQRDHKDPKETPEQRDRKGHKDHREKLDHKGFKVFRDQKEILGRKDQWGRQE